MNDLLKNKLEIIVNDELLIKAIRIVFDETIEKEKPKVQDTDSNLLLGEKYRAYELSKKIIEKGFIDLMSYKINKNPNLKFNKGR